VICHRIAIMIGPDTATDLLPVRTFAGTVEGGQPDSGVEAAPDHFRIFVNGQTDQDHRTARQGAPGIFFRVDVRLALPPDARQLVGLPGE